MTVSEGFEKYYPKENTWLQIMKPIYRFKQAGLYYYQKTKRAMQANGPDSIVIWITWVDDNLFITPTSIMDKEKDMIKCHFKCDNIGELS
ncbi:hypothetical protein ACHAXS_001213 [Conticribra weissflogii]